MKSLEILRKRYPRFIYQKYSYHLRGSDLAASFYFKIEPDIKFRTIVRIKNVPVARLGRIDKKALNNFVFHLGMMEIPTYWKSTCSQEIAVRAGFITKDQASWWEKTILKGMGQFFYENKIDFRENGFLRVVNNPSISAQPLGMFVEDLDDTYLIPVGGGKDSIVTLEKVKEKGEGLNCFLLNPKKAQKKIMKMAGVKDPVVVERKIDPALLKLNGEGYLNGHTPFTAVLSFAAVFCAALFNYGNVLFSNEKSSNEGNVVYLGNSINHQYAKSSDFERRFKDYLKRYLTPSVRYSSYLRKYTELQIAEIFTRYPKYFSVFSSCNVGLKTGERWCGNCPKCLFVYASLYPYLSHNQLEKTFGKDIFDNRKLLPVMKQLLGKGEHKPFECVGTYEETSKAFGQSLVKARRSGSVPYLLRKFDEVK